jgi:hypothetical protein
MNTAIASAHKANGFIFLPREINNGLTLRNLAAVGIKVTGEENDNGMCKCELPEDWSSIESFESPMQLRLIDDQCRLRAKIYYKVGSQGGGASMEMMPRYHILVKTANLAQWAEVYDGFSLMYRTKVTPWSDRMSDELAMLTEHEQPEYKEAEDRLAALLPNYKDPLAYWN